MDDRDNHHTGDMYRSSKGRWYVHTPSEWSNRHTWVLMSPEEILNLFNDYLSVKQKTEIAEVAGLDWE